LEALTLAIAQKGDVTVTREMLLFMAEYADRLAHFFLQSILRPEAASLSPEAAAHTEELFSRLGTAIFSRFACLPLHLLHANTPQRLLDDTVEFLAVWRGMDFVSPWKLELFRTPLRRWSEDVEDANTRIAGDSSSNAGVTTLRTLSEDEWCVIWQTIMLIVSDVAECVGVAFVANHADLR
jgi:hypothetical protein